MLCLLLSYENSNVSVDASISSNSTTEMQHKVCLFGMGGSIQDTVYGCLGLYLHSHLVISHTVVLLLVVGGFNHLVLRDSMQHNTLPLALW